MTFWKWSRTAATNATADSTINWAEGQAPSSVNDSARALMAAASKYRDDMGGSITTAGTSTAYTVTSFQVFTALQAGLYIAFCPHTTNGATPTINVDSLGAKPLRSAPGVEFPSGVLVQGTPYVASYFTSNSGEWIVNGLTNNPYNVPIGGMMPYVGTTAPNSSFVLPFGQAISRTTYATLFGLTSTTWGTGDGSTTFNLPDLRGRAVFGLDNMGGSAASRITVAGGNWDGTVLEATARGAQNHTLLTTEMPSHSHTDSGHTHTSVSTTGYKLPNAANNTQGGSSFQSLLNTGSVDPNTLSTGTGAASLSDTGGGGAHTIMPPALVLPYILRII